MASKGSGAAAGSGIANSLGPGASTLFHLSRILGVAPFRQTSTTVVRSRGWEVYSLLLCLSNIAMINYSSFNIYKKLTGSFYQDMFGMTYIIKGTCAWCLHLVSLARRRHVLRAFNSILRYEAFGRWPAGDPDAACGGGGWCGGSWRGGGRCGRGGVVAAVVGAQLLAIASVFIWTFALSWTFLARQNLLGQLFTLYCNYLPPLYIFTMDLQFGNMALLVYRQLRDLSRGASRLLRRRAADARGRLNLGLNAGVVIGGPPGPGPPPGLQQATRQLRARQEHIYTTIGKLNSAYSVQLLLSVTLCLEETTSGLYFAITSQYSQWKPLIAAWATVSVSKLALVMTPCQWVESEGEVITDAVNSALQIRNLSRADREELEEFQVQLVHLKMRFSAGGIFPLDYSQLQKVISTITTYLVILLQMQGRPPRPGQA